MRGHLIHQPLCRTASRHPWSASSSRNIGAAVGIGIGIDKQFYHTKGSALCRDQLRTSSRHGTILFPCPMNGLLRSRAFSTTLNTVIENGIATAPSGTAGLPTIYALSTAPGRAAIAVVRVSGSACLEIYRSLCPGKPSPRARYATVRALHDPMDACEVLDAGALVLYFPSPQTVTGEDVLELHVHGGPAVVKAVLRAIKRCNTVISTSSASPATTRAGAVAESPRIRYAEPGEFTKRAFLNDRLDLPQIEALGATLTAETEVQRQLAVRGTSDTLARRYEAWRMQLLSARGELEALIDFSEDQQLDAPPARLVSGVREQVTALVRAVRLHVANAARGELMRGGIGVALLGAPNAGKSSLLNCAIGREAAIVSSERGTTRDVVDVGVDLGGWFCRFGDMAGLRSGRDAGDGSTTSKAGTEIQMPKSGDILPSTTTAEVIGAVEQEGIRRAKARALESDVVIVVLSLEDVDGHGLPRIEAEPEVVEAARDCLALDKWVLVVINKCDKLWLMQGRDHSGLDEAAYIEAARSYFGGQVAASDVFLISCLDADRSRSVAGVDANNIATNPDPDPGHLQRFLQGLIQTFRDMAAPTTSEVDSQAGDDALGRDLDAAAVASATYYADSLAVTHRQSALLEACSRHLADFLDQTQTTTAGDVGLGLAVADDYDVDVEIDVVTAAEHLRFAADCLAQITGQEGSDVEDVLGVVFERFCVGK